MTETLVLTASVAWPALAGCLVALATSLLVLLTKEHHGHLTMDSAIGIQKFHVNPTPRVGGIGIYLGVWAAWLLTPEKSVKQILSVILLAGFPALACGLLEDVTKVVGVLPRLLATMAGSVVAWLMTGIALDRLDVQGLDSIMALTPVGVVFTAFAVGGVANAINIIDGFHGLASGTTILALLAIAAIAMRSADPQLAIACVLVAAALVGFWLVNYPWGKLFLGDGGAYFAGFALAWLAVLLSVRNPDVSPWASLLVCAYPIIETLYSVVRRYVARQSPAEADSRHLHSLIKTQIIRKKLFWMTPGMRNAAVSPIVWGFAAFPAVLAIAFFDRSALLMSAMLFCLVLYHLTYAYLAENQELASVARPASGELQVHQLDTRQAAPRHQP
jgi:UDP-N-acetylmuramyl pentapeptide phosphotransferase/UDP-N-acetylglucosamine-1-phosphate transferase